MDTESKNYKTPSYMRKATLKYYYKCKDDPDKQTHIKERQQRNAKSYYERNKEKIRERERLRYATKKAEKLAKKEAEEAERANNPAEDEEDDDKIELKLSIKLNKYLSCRPFHVCTSL